MNRLSQRFDCADWFGMFSRGQDRFNPLMLLMTRENFILTGTQPGIG